jgi:hypothetical protein
VVGESGGIVTVMGEGNACFHEMSMTRYLFAPPVVTWKSVQKNSAERQLKSAALILSILYKRLRPFLYYR